MQEEVSEKIKDVIKDDIWVGIRDFLDLGFHFGEGENQVHFTIGLLLLVIWMTPISLNLLVYSSL